MNKKIVFMVMLVFLLVSAAVIAYSQSSQNVRWEYTSVFGYVSSPATQKRVNDLGQQGWELVCNQGDSGDLLVFKRRLP
jgi:hypothetical protein